MLVPESLSKYRYHYYSDSYISATRSLNSHANFDSPTVMIVDGDFEIRPTPE